eukprot:gene18202-biopygen21931
MVTPAASNMKSVPTPNGAKTIAHGRQDELGRAQSCCWPVPAYFLAGTRGTATCSPARAGGGSRPPSRALPTRG